MNERLDRLDSSLARLERIASLSKWVFGGLVSLVVAVFALGVMYQRTLSEIAQLGSRVSAIETDRATLKPIYDEKIRSTQLDVATIKNDVSWIRSALEKPRP